MRCTPSGWHPVLSASSPASSGYRLASSQVLLPLMNGCSKMCGMDVYYCAILWPARLMDCMWMQVSWE